MEVGRQRSNQDCGQRETVVGVVTTISLRQSGTRVYIIATKEREK